MSYDHPLIRDSKNLLRLMKDRPSPLGLKAAAETLYGIFGRKNEPFRLGETEFQFSGNRNLTMGLIPTPWKTALDLLSDRWSGCEKWWAGYPLIALVELRILEGSKGQLRLHMEVGPLCSHHVRKELISLIKKEASAARLGRIEFQIGAEDRGRLYSRFLTHNATEVDDMASSQEVERRLDELVSSFAPEFQLIATTLRAFRI